MLLLALPPSAAGERNAEEEAETPMPAPPPLTELRTPPSSGCAIPANTPDLAARVGDRGGAAGPSVGLLAAEADSDPLLTTRPDREARAPTAADMAGPGSPAATVRGAVRGAMRGEGERMRAPISGDGCTADEETNAGSSEPDPTTPPAPLSAEPWAVGGR